MSFLDNLEQLMYENNIKNISILSKKSGIPYTTLKNFYTRGADNIGLSTLKKIADYFDITLDYLVYHNYVIQCSKDEFELIKTFRKLNNQGQKYITQTMDMAKDKYSNKENCSDSEEEYITEVAARGNSKLKVNLSKKAVAEDLKKPVSTGFDD